MKKLFKLFIISILCLFYTTTNAQDGYSYTLVHNGNYNFTIQAVPNTSSNNFATSVQSYGFTIIVPDGVTIDTGNTTSLGSAANATFFDGSAIGQTSIDGYLITETLGAPFSFPAPSAATNSDMFTFTVNGNPASGTLYILENNSSIATTITALKSFMQADMIDNGMAEFVNVVDPNGPAVSGMSSFDFNTLSIDEIDSESYALSLHPNPTKNFFSIITELDIELVELYDLTGKKVLSVSTKNKVDISNLSSGVYLSKLYFENTTITRKIIKE